MYVKFFIVFDGNGCLMGVCIVQVVFYVNYICYLCGSVFRYYL